MDNTQLIDNLHELCMVHGVSGHEHEVVRLLKEKLGGYPGFFLDNMGNICIEVKGKGLAPSMMLTAHTDEVGGIINGIMPNGLLSFRTVGGIDPDTLSAARVLVGSVKGTISCVSAHIKAEIRNPKLYIDIGAETSEEVAELGVKIGDPVSLDTEFVRMGKHRVCSRVIDDRIGCAILLEVLTNLKEPPLGTIYFTFSVREETTMSGALMLANRFLPDCAIAVDTVPINDVYNGGSHLSLAKGPVLQLMDGIFGAFTGNAAHHGLVDFIKSCSEESSIPYQLCAEVGSWVTDGDTLYKAGTGIPTAYISIPRRYAHSASELLDLRDAYNAVQLIQAVIKNMARINLSFI